MLDVSADTSKVAAEPPGVLVMVTAPEVIDGAEQLAKSGVNVHVITSFA